MNKWVIARAAKLLIKSLEHVHRLPSLPCQPQSFPVAAAEAQGLPPPHERLVHSSASHSLRTSTPPVIPAAATKWDPGGTWVPGPTSWSHHRAHPCRMHSPPLLRARTVRQAPLGTARALPRPRGASATLCSTLPLLLLFNRTLTLCGAGRRPYAVRYGGRPLALLHRAVDERK